MLGLKIRSLLELWPMVSAKFKNGSRADLGSWLGLRLKTLLGLVLELRTGLRLWLCLQFIQSGIQSTDMSPVESEHDELESNLAVVAHN